MKPISLDKSAIFLFAIIGVVAAAGIFLAPSLRADAVDQALKSDRILNLAVIIEREGKPASTQAFFFYPANARAALLDVPGETGLIIASLDRVDRIDAPYDPRRPGAFVKEVAGLLKTELPYWLVIDEDGLGNLVDLLEGIEVFAPAQIESEGPPRVLLPSGAVLLDGGKAAQFAFYADPEEDDAGAANRRQRFFQSLVRRIGEKAEWLARPDVYPAFRANVETNFTDDSFRKLLLELAKLDADRLVLQRVTGVFRAVDGKKLLFPHYDGELVRDIVKQTLNALATSGSDSPADKIFSIEVLNGTTAKGLAKRAAEIFQSFGYDVVSIGNAERDDYESTSVVDRFGNPEAVMNVAEVIRCSDTRRSTEDPDDGAAADFIVILGKDFNGRYCVK